MKLMRGSDAIVVSTLEDMVKLNNLNMASIANNFGRLIKKNKRLTFFTALNGIGLLYLIKENKKRADDVDRLKEETREILDDYKVKEMCKKENDPCDEEEFDDIWG